MQSLHKNNFIRPILGFTLAWHGCLLAAQESIPSPTVAPSSEPPPNAIPAEPNLTSGEPPIFTSTLERDNALLALALPNEVQWLETPRGKIIALFKAGETRKTQGSLLILHAPELPQLWPTPLENLRRNLPIYGWDTLAVPLPSLQAIETFQRNKPADTNSSIEQTTSTSSGSAFKQPIAPSLRTQMINERITAAIILLGKIGQPNPVVLVDNSSAPDSLVELYKNNIQTLILVNLQNQEPLTQAQLATIFSQINLPILDVFFNPDDKNQIEVRRLHKAEAMRKDLKNYHQLILPPENFAEINNKPSFWLEKVRGFINKKPAGNALNKEKG